MLRDALRCSRMLRGALGLLQGAPGCCSMVGDGSKMLRDALGRSEVLQNAAGCSRMLWDAKGSSGTFRGVWGCSDMIGGAPGCCRTLGDALRCSEMLRDAPGCCSVLWDAQDAVGCPGELRNVSGHLGMLGEVLRCSGTLCSYCWSRHGPAAPRNPPKCRRSRFLPHSGHETRSLQRLRPPGELRMATGKAAGFGGFPLCFRALPGPA